ncbi:MAG: NAD-dependent epimerase/dehydratase family protein [Candidatus Berkelbacteria bacterium]|nr:NAD-dependent epimerase/dehydratase family protein [Candidatus Berkelbacteria bacterium]
MSKVKRKIFITGGSGFLGINLVRYLLASGYEIITYDLAPFDYPEKFQVRAIYGDIRNHKELERAMAGCDLIVHTAAALPLYSKKDIFSTDVLGTRNVLSAAVKNKIKRVVMISSTAVYGIPDHHPLVENDKLVGVGPYGEAKIAAEKECLKFRRRDLVIPIIRPKSFIGPERLGVFAMFYDWARSGHGFPLIGNGKNRYQLLDVEDLCQAIFLCLTLSSKKVDDTFNIAAEEFTTMREDYQSVLDAAGFGKKIKTFPARPMILILRFLEKLHLSPLYKWVYETAATDSSVSINKAKKVLGFRPQFSNKNALLRNYKWYLANLNNIEGKSGVSHRAPWKQGILAFVKKFF